jgi:acetylornithine deacetylase/succinyl-diaminopimelate desuccinylase-like protein
MTQPTADEVRHHADEQFDRTLERLTGYLRHPAISCDPDHFDDVRRLAGRIRDDLEALGFSRSRVLDLDDALPCVAAEKLDAGPDRPTVLIYGHMDLQPVKGEPWLTPPHEPVEKNGRLYARGSGDDMGGWVSHLAAVEAWLAVAGRLPLNVKLIIEGEEEIGSPNLERYMDAFPDTFDADVMVLTDCDNPSTDIPGLTVSLRGLIELEITCEALHSDLHSGIWGNMVPDATTSLVKILARLIDDDGRLALPLVDVPEDWRDAARKVSPDARSVARDARLVDGVAALPEHGRSLAEWGWRQSAVTIVATTLPTPDVKKNAIRAQASAVLSVRVAPGLDARDLKAAITEIVTRDPTGGVKVSVKQLRGTSDAWLYTPEGPAFAAADRAYTKAWGHGLVQIGIGGSIPFVALFARRFGHLPLILNGVLDPASSIHGPNESMDLGVFKKAIATNVYLLDELSRLDPA